MQCLSQEGEESLAVLRESCQLCKQGYAKGNARSVGCHL